MVHSHTEMTQDKAAPQNQQQRHTELIMMSQDDTGNTADQAEATLNQRPIILMFL